MVARARSGQSDLIIAVIAFGIVLLALLPLTYSTITNYFRTGASEIEILNKIRESQLLQSSLMNEVNVTALKRTDGTLEIWITNGGGKTLMIQKVLALITISNNTYLTDLTQTITDKQLISVNPSSQLHLLINLSKTLENVANQQITISSVLLITPEGGIITAKLYTEELLEQIALSSITKGQPISKVYKLLGFPVESNDNISDPGLILQKNYEIYSVPLVDLGTPLTRIDLNSSAPELLRQPDPDKYVSYGGVEGVEYGLVLKDVFRNTNISTPRPLVMGNMFLTFYPGSSDKYIIEFSYSTDKVNILDVGNMEYDLGGVCPYGYRVKIIGYTGRIGLYQVSNDTSRTITPLQDPAALLYNYDPLHDNYRYLILNGHADTVRVYCRSPIYKTSSYAPYISYVATQPGSNYANILFTFEDVYFGWANTYNDIIKSRWYYIGDLEDDFSESALVFVYKGNDLVISNTNSSAIAIVLNYRFHDNEGNDYSGVTEDRPIMVVGLVDEHGYVLSYRTYTFRELTRYEDTYPPTSEAQSSLVFIPLPPSSIVGEKRYYVFLLIQDPYSIETSGQQIVDDVDYVLYISDLSVLLFGG